MKISVLFLLCMGFFGFQCHAASIEKASMLNLHGLRAEAKSELIEVIFSAANESSKAEAYYMLGSIALEEKKISVAFETWTQLMSKFPSSQQAALVKDHIKELAETIGEVSKSTVENVIAQSHLRNADFWSKGKSQIFNIDSSWIQEEDAAIKWYDKTIQEFPKSVAARLAYEDKMRTLIGWKDVGSYGDSHGVEGDFGVYMPKLLKTFAAYEADFPESTMLQSFRYQIAQLYWVHKDWEKTKEWLKIIVEKAGDKDTFYRDLAERRLNKVEH